MNTDKPGPAVLRRVDCVRLPVDDLESGLVFYRDALGLELVWRDCDSAGLRMPVDGTEIVIHTGGGGPETDLLVNSADGSGPGHFRGWRQRQRCSLRHPHRAVLRRPRPVGQRTRATRLLEGASSNR